jgi:hypothetical protein
MNAPRIPKVIVVDDLPDDMSFESVQVNSDGAIELQVIHPKDVALEDITGAVLVLVDYVLDDWLDSQTPVSLSSHPPTGLALAAILQEHAHRSQPPGPRAFALHTGKAEALRHDLAGADHLVARTHNLDWVFSKKTPFEQKWSQIAELARAVQALPLRWSLTEANASEAALSTWLKLPQEAHWTRRAWRDVEDCHPPLHELASTTHGGSIVRWMLHRILPHPTFLIGAAYVAARLKVTITSFTAALNTRAFSDWIGQARYSGELATFSGERWWRSGVESLAFEATVADPGSTELLLKHVQGLAPMLEPCSLKEPVVTVDEDYRATDSLVELADAVRIVPDDWPPFADVAWTSIELAREDPRLRALVASADRDRLDEVSPS